MIKSTAAQQASARASSVHPLYKKQKITMAEQSDKCQLRIIKKRKKYNT